MNYLADEFKRLRVLFVIYLRLYLTHKDIHFDKKLNSEACILH